VTAPNPLQTDEAHDHRQDASPRWKDACRGWYDRAALTAMAADPAIGIRRMGALGVMARVLGAHGPARADVRALFPALKRARATRLVNRMASLHFRNRAAIALVRRGGLGALAALVDGHSESAPAVIARRERGLILVAYHVGAHFGVGAALHRWGTPVLTLRNMPLGDADARARALKLAVETVNARGVVMAAIDGPGGVSSTIVPCLGRRIVVRRGPLAVARLTGAPVVPVVAQWTDHGRIRILTGSPFGLPPPDDPAFERAAALAVARWLELHLTTYPDDLWPYTLRNLLASPGLSAEGRLA
jgi:lauroyl/myristoyl acyltransferase